MDDFFDQEEISDALPTYSWEPIPLPLELPLPIQNSNTSKPEQKSGYSIIEIDLA